MKKILALIFSLIMLLAVAGTTYAATKDFQMCHFEVQLIPQPDIVKIFVFGKNTYTFTIHQASKMEMTKVCETVHINVPDMPPKPTFPPFFVH